MSRSGYDEDWDDYWNMIRWRGAVAAAFRGRRGQAFLRELLAAFDALPEKKLIAHDLMNDQGEVCALGAVAKTRSLDMSKIDPEDPEGVANLFGIAGAMAREIMWANDEAIFVEDPGHRFDRMRQWITARIKT